MRTSHRSTNIIQDSNMTKLLVTGATGHLGRQTIEFLRGRVPAERIVALARDPAALADMAASGIEVRRGDYFDKASLVAAFAGVEKLLLVSAVAFTDRITQHQNVISTAKEAGVRHIIFTSIQRKAVDPLVISMVTESDVATEEALKASGLEYTILYNALYLGALTMMIGDPAAEDGVRVPGGSGKGALVARRDLAEANAVILATSGHENRSYTLGGAETISFADIAKTLGDIAGKPVAYIDTPVDAYVAAKIALSFPPAAAAFLAEWAKAVAVGEYAEITGDLERLIGRKPVSFADFLAAGTSGLPA
jgi:NAD(P)H dehydrogenase (quinone)